jgi:hypothetical protein
MNRIDFEADIKNNVNKELEGKPKELVNEARKLVTPKNIQNVYMALCPNCKRLALCGKTTFCDKCKTKVEEILSDAYN